MEHRSAIVVPVFALVAWTLLILLNVLRARVASRLHPKVFRYGESADVPERVALANRNYMNLLELPVLFYVACVLLYVVGGNPSGGDPLGGNPSGGVPAAAPVLAWTYVALRIAHSLVHLTYNNVIHRLLVFAASNFVLIGLWIVAWQALVR